MSQQCGMASSPDEGLTWTSIPTFRGQSTVNVASSFDENDGVILFYINNSIFVSKDSMNSWEEYNKDNGFIGSVMGNQSMLYLDGTIFHTHYYGLQVLNPKYFVK